MARSCAQKKVCVSLVASLSPYHEFKLATPMPWRFTPAGFRGLIISCSLLAVIRKHHTKLPRLTYNQRWQQTARLIWIFGRVHKLRMGLCYLNLAAGGSERGHLTSTSEFSKETRMLEKTVAHHHGEGWIPAAEAGP
jgi:hypothetical protein